MTEAQIRHMVDQFLRWKLPADFCPDGGVKFDRAYNNGTPEGGKHEPIGTNLLTHTQAEAMVRNMLDGLPSD